MIEGGAKNAWQEAVIDNLPPLEALVGAEREVMEYDVVIVGGGPAGLDFRRRAGEVGRDRRPCPVGRRDRSQGAERALPRLEGTRRAAGDAGDQGQVPGPGPAGAGVAADVRPAALHAQRRLLHRLAGQCRALAGRTGGRLGRRGLSRHGRQPCGLGGRDRPGEGRRRRRLRHRPRG
uniref:Pyr_redox_2 domain-containing protein n=1 Tax=Parastrongyloides trichosuri TaxID=131310 RepID=A0A0N4ZGQ6_PARTI